MKNRKIFQFGNIEPIIQMIQGHGTHLTRHFAWRVGNGFLGKNVHGENIIRRKRLDGKRFLGFLGSKRGGVHLGDVEKKKIDWEIFS